MLQVRKNMNPTARTVTYYVIGFVVDGIIAKINWRPPTHDVELLDCISQSIKSRLWKPTSWWVLLSFLNPSLFCGWFRLCLLLQDSIGLLLDAVRTSDEDLAKTWKKSEQWATIEQLCSKSPWISEGPVIHPVLASCYHFHLCSRIENLLVWNMFKSEGWIRAELRRRGQQGSFILPVRILDSVNSS